MSDDTNENKATANASSVWEDETAPLPKASKPRSSRRTAVGAGVGAVVLAVGSFFGIQTITYSTTAAAGQVASGAGHGGFMTVGGGTSGTLTTIADNTLTLRTGTGDAITINVSDRTSFFKTTTSTVDALEVGDNVSVAGSSSGSTVTALTVTDSGAAQPPTGEVGLTPPEDVVRGGSNNVVGTIASINGDAITVTTTNGTTTVKTSDDTIVTSLDTVKLSDLAVGDTVRVQGSTADNGFINATSIIQGVTVRQPSRICTNNADRPIVFLDGPKVRNVQRVSVSKGSLLSDYEFRTQIFAPGNELELHKDDIWSILELADKDFVPPLSQREPITLGEMKRAKGAWSLPIEHLDFILKMHVIIVWNDKESVVGFLSFKPDFQHETIEQYKSCVLIDTVAVAPAWRRRGAARALYKALFDSELFQSYEDSVLHTWSTNTSHGQLIESIGFEEIDRNIDERAPGVDTVIYHRKNKPNPFADE